MCAQWPATDNSGAASFMIFQLIRSAGNIGSTTLTKEFHALRELAICFRITRLYGRAFQLRTILLVSGSILFCMSIPGDELIL